MTAALVVLCVITVCSLIFAAIVWGGADERREAYDAAESYQREALAEREAQYHQEHLDLQKSYAAMVESHQRQIERLLTAALDRDGLINLRRIEAGETARERAVRPDLLRAVLDRQMDAQDDDQRYANVGFE